MPTSFAEALNLALAQAMESDPKVFAYGEGINDPGGFFGTTAGIAERFGEARCFDVPNSEEALTGFGLGASLLGYRPVFVNLRADFLMLAMNQIVNHVAKWRTMSGGRCTNPLVIRAIIGKEWGQAAQHSGAYHPLFAHVPGLQVALPASVADAAGLLLSALQSEMPTIMLELKTLYTLNEPVEHPFKPVPFGRARIARPGSDLTAVAVSEMVGFACEIADALAPQGMDIEVVDLRCVQPLDEAAVAQSVAKTGRVAVFDITWQKFGLAAEVARILCSSPDVRLKAPLVSVGREWEHTPASCFYELHHYPNRDAVLERLLSLS